TANERESATKGPLDHFLIQRVVVRHHEDDSIFRKLTSHLIVVADDTTDTREPPLFSPWVARVDDSDREADASQERRRGARDITAGDDEARGERKERLEQDPQASSAAHPELGPQTKLAHLVVRRFCLEYPGERAQNLAFDGSAADRANACSVD